MSNTDKKQIIALWIIAAATFVFMVGGLYLTRPTETDTERCVEVSNYTQEQCKHELSI